MSTLETSVRAEYTPNPNSLKFVCNESLYPYSGSLSYENKKSAEEAGNELAAKMFDIEGIEKVFIMSNFVTIDKAEHINWKDVHVDIKNNIKVGLKDFQAWAEANKPPEPEIKEGDASDEGKRARIEEVLNKIRPALVADGGNIELVDLVGMDVRLRMVGACGTCPSSMMTMKMGVERALLAEVPDIVETVTQVF